MCYSRDLFFFLGRIICRREKQYWTPCRNFSARTPNKFWLNFKSDKNRNVFPQHQFFLELFLRTCRIQFWQPCMMLSPNSVNLTLQFPKKSKFVFHSRDLFFLGMIISLREMQFWPPCRIFSAKTPNIFWLQFKSDKTVNFFPNIKFFSKCSFVHVECSFDNRAWSFHTKLRKFDARILKKKWKFMCYSRDFFFFLGRIICGRGMQFWPPCRTFAKTPNIFWLKFKSDKTVNFFLQHQFFLDLFLRTCRMQFWQPCLKLPHQTP